MITLIAMMVNMREAILYKKLMTKVQCRLGAHYCVIQKARKVFAECGKIKVNCFVGLQPVAINVDPLRKTFVSLLCRYKKILSLEPGCNFRCGFCQNWE